VMLPHFLLGWTHASVWSVTGELAEPQAFEILF
jgi:hypothetical protein